ncbi:M20/M25/M40 family metallo-hydrolase [Saccharopolyspora indica]|uniref:M20/M25/M40 family metallo-hydrolase n=1 Tax=Saccharopolyspora indica TaxID=1229659 RepID=UPI0022EB567F|nr:M20/M25/M40 family metallo-hydrolase [Saccharopolyspora indica]MDA3649487.1 M20/M25/M40 family metallo-hydrolase [Saccharopolyspora indica]
MNGKSISTRFRVPGVLAVLAVLVVTVFGAASVQQPDRDAPAGEFSAERAIAELRGFATEPRPMGSAAADRARDHLVGRLRAAGLQVEVQSSLGAYAATGLATFGQVDNVVATLPGTASTGAVLLAAHYDSAGVGPGASDDGASVAAMLETVRALRESGPLRNDLVLLITDGEEDGSLGAGAFAREHPLAARGGVVLNWEARGVDGPSLMFETTEDNARLIEVFADSVEHPRGDSSMVEMYRLMPNSTDFTDLAAAGFAGLNSAYLEGSSRYHTASDTIANLNPGSLQHQGENMLALTRAFGGADLADLRADHDLVYFRALGLLITYPDAVVLPLALLNALLLVGAVVLARYRRLISLPRTLLSALSALVPIAVAVVLAQELWSLLVAVRPDYDLMNGLLHRPLAFLLALAALTGTALIAWYLALRTRLGPTALALGALTWPTAAGIACAFLAPGAAFVFTVPALAGALGLLLAMFFPRWSAIAIAAAAAVAAVVVPVVARTVFNGMGLALGGATAALIVLFGLFLVPLGETLLPDRALSRRSAVLAVSTALGATIALVLSGLAIDRFDAQHPRRSHLAYVLDADTRTASWVSAEAEPTEWTAQFVGTRNTDALPPGYARGELWTGPAQPLAVDGPLVTGTRTGDTANLHVSSARGARSVVLRVDQPITEVTARMPGGAPVALQVSGTRTATWPGEIRFRDLPPEGVEISLRTRGGQVQVTAIDETRGLAAAPGFRPRPADLEAGTREDGDLVAVARTYRF